MMFETAYIKNRLVKIYPLLVPQAAGVLPTAQRQEPGAARAGSQDAPRPGTVATVSSCYWYHCDS